MDPFLLEFLLEDDMNFVNINQIIINENERQWDLIPERDVPVFNEGYVENSIPRYSVSEFKNHFRMSKADVEELCIQLAAHMQGRHLFIPLETKVLFFIWLIAKQESFLACSDRFGFAKGTGHYIFKSVLSAVVMLKEQYIFWPNEQAIRDIAQRTQARYGIPGVVGFIDGCHINIKQPTHNPIDFYNRKEQHSIILQAICDDRKILTDVFIGMPGRVHDARVFRSSPIYGQIIGNPPLLPAEQHIIGDAAYPLLSNLLKPYRDNGHLNPRQTRFNQVLSSARSVIERTFALLKGKWRRLKYLDMSLAERIPEVILSACILHNFVLRRSGADEEGNDAIEEHVEIQEEYDIEEGNNTGVLKRDYIAAILV